MNGALRKKIGLSKECTAHHLVQLGQADKDQTIKELVVITLFLC